MFCTKWTSVINLNENFMCEIGVQLSLSLHECINKQIIFKLVSNVLVTVDSLIFWFPSFSVEIPNYIYSYDNMFIY